MNETSLLPIDVGFDVKAQGIPVTIRPYMQTVKYLDRCNLVASFTGTGKEIVKALRLAGYSVKVKHD